MDGGRTRLVTRSNSICAVANAHDVARRATTSASARVGVRIMVAVADEADGASISDGRKRKSVVFSHHKSNIMLFQFHYRTLRAPPAPTTST